MSPVSQKIMHAGNIPVKHSSYIPKLQTDAKSYSQNQEDQETGACEGFLLTVYHLYLLRGKLFGQS